MNKMVKNTIIHASIILLSIWILFSYVFVFTKSDGNMSPNIKLNDTVMTFCLDRSFKSGDVITYSNGNNLSQYRVVAVQGDTVDIKNGSLFVNGYEQAETYLCDQTTTAWQDSTQFPLTVGNNQVFVLQDIRKSSTDSRIFGCIDTSSIKGKVVLVLRRNNI